MGRSNFTKNFKFIYGFKFGGKPIKYYSSDRIAQLVGNGLLTFIDEKLF